MSNQKNLNDFTALKIDNNYLLWEADLFCIFHTFLYHWDTEICLYAQHFHTIGF